MIESRDMGKFKCRMVTTADSGISEAEMYKALSKLDIAINKAAESIADEFGLEAIVLRHDTVRL